MIAPAVKADGYADPYRSYMHRAAYRRRNLYRHPVREEEERPRQVCMEKVRGVGTQWIGEQGALDAAKKDWMERVRFDLGETFLDMSHAQDFIKRCGRTSIGEIAGQVFYRCEIVARPCKAEFEQQEGQR